MKGYFKPISTLVFVLMTIQVVNSQEFYSDFELTGRQQYDTINEYKNLQKEVYVAFLKMKKAALKDSVFIGIASGYRSFERQKIIWNRKYRKYIKMGFSPGQTVNKIIEYSTIPGTSRHHWGTDIDIYDYKAKKTGSILNEVNYNNGGVYEKLKLWMDKNSEKFGFYLVYTNNKKRKGFKYEPWHYTFKKISKPMLKDFLMFDIRSFLNNQNVQGKEELSPEFIDKYISENILDINDKLKL